MSGPVFSCAGRIRHRWHDETVLANPPIFRHFTVPLTSRWEYEPEVGTEEGTPEKTLLDILRTPVEWA